MGKFIWDNIRWVLISIETRMKSNLTKKKRIDEQKSESKSNKLPLARFSCKSKQWSRSSNIHNVRDNAIKTLTLTPTAYTQVRGSKSFASLKIMSNTSENDTIPLNSLFHPVNWSKRQYFLLSSLSGPSVVADVITASPAPKKLFAHSRNSYVVFGNKWYTS